MADDKPVAFYIPSLTGGGAQRVTVNLVNELAERGLDVNLVVSHRTGELVGEVNDAVPVVDLKTPRIPVAGVAASIPAFVRYIRQENPSIVFSQMHYANVISVVAERLANRETALVLTEHTIFGKANQQKDSVVFALAKRLYPFADHVIAVSSGVAKSISTEVEIPNDRISVIHNPIVTPALGRQANEPTGHRWLDASDSTVVLGVGRMIPDKDFITLVEAVARVSETDPSLRLVILGKGPRREALERTAANLGISDELSLPGYVDNPYSYMRRADTFVLSSKREGLPTALVEAMACGCPVVATDCRSGPREILADGTYGPLIPVGDSESLAAGIREVLRDPVPPSALEQRAEAFSVKTVVDEYERLIDQHA